MRFYIGVLLIFWAFALWSQPLHHSDIDTSYFYKVIKAQQDLINVQTVIIDFQDSAIKQSEKAIYYQSEQVRIGKKHSFYLATAFYLMLAFVVLFAAFFAFFEFISPIQIDNLFNWLSAVKAKFISFFIKK